MEITGYDYAMYSQISFSELENEIIERINGIWKNPIIDKIVEDDCNKTTWLYITKDLDMYHDNTVGYEPNAEGESGFSIIANNTPFEDIILIGTDMNRKLTHDIRFIFSNFWTYTLVLPEVIEKSHFSMRIYDMLVSILTKNNISERGLNTTIQKPVQYFI